MERFKSLQEVLFAILCGYKLLAFNWEFRVFDPFFQIASNCTSFCVHKEYLLLTTLTHTVQCICRKTKVEGKVKI